VIEGLKNPEHLAKATEIFVNIIDDCEKNHTFVSSSDL
jgi:hypothetical protein